MLISYKWLQKYFDEKLPAPEKLVDLITFGFAEVESVSDTVFDIKVLPDRACYALSHRGVAKEIAALLNTKIKTINVQEIKESETTPFKLSIAEPMLCAKFVSRKIENVKVAPSPDWLKESLASMGSRSINNIVDATNYVMFDTGRPLHAFDADKVEGELVVRLAKKGERIMTLDNKDIELDEKVLVIADDKGPLGIAGIKGGKRAEVDANTKNLILEGANWNASYIRKASTRIGVRTDASKRFENRLSPLLAEEGVDDVTRIILDTASTKDTKVGKKIIVSNEVYKPTSVKITAQEISQVLGITLTEEKIIAILKQLFITSRKEGDSIIVEIPDDRLDLTIPEDIVEEVGRIYGYEKIKGILPKNQTFVPKVNKNYYYAEKIKNILAGQAFSEVYLYTLVAKGDIEVAKPLASDKSHLRKNLTDGMKKCLETNTLNAPLLGLEKVKIFEIGKVFDSKKESWSLAIGGAGVREAFMQVGATLGVELKPTLETEGKITIGEIILDSIFEKLPEPTSYADLHFTKASNNKYQKFSLYPFIVRDIALFVPKEVTPEEVIKVIKEVTTDLLLKGPTLFDDFTNKEGKRSLAFRMIYQSMERTLSDAEVNEIMEKIYTKIKGKNWVVR